MFKFFKSKSKTTVYEVWGVDLCLCKGICIATFHSKECADEYLQTLKDTNDDPTLDYYLEERN